MPTEIPPPGRARDEAIAAALGWTRIGDCYMEAIGTYRGGVQPGDTRHPASLLTSIPFYSTDPAACDRLVEEMVRRGWRTTTFADPGGHRAGISHYPGCRCAHPVMRGTTRTDAVSAAALLALRGAP